MDDDDSVLVVGAGAIGREHFKILRRLGCTRIDILTRTEASADRARAMLLPNRARSGGSSVLSEIVSDYRFVVVAVPVDDLLPALRIVAERAPEAEVLVEKPVALYSAALASFLVDFPHCRAMAGLNRLFFPSIMALRARLADDPPLSGRFCFTEWTHTIPTAQFTDRVLARWGVANSIHLISTFFDLVGDPESINAVSAGADAIPWHPSGARFYGSGLTRSRQPFAYDANWQSSGRHALEIFTGAGAYTLRPLHELRFTRRGSVDDEVVEPMYQGELKCGFEAMLSTFLAGAPDARGRLGLPRLLRHIRTVETIFGYPAESS